jgi:divalent metal cation (Fe/Co/Zn/Cd) transporter
MDSADFEEEYQRVEKIIQSTEGVLGFHDLKKRKMGDMILVDEHLDVDAQVSVMEGHNIDLAVRNQIMKELPVLNVMTHVDPV